MQPQGTPSMTTPTTNATNMNIVLVHGTWVDGSSWSKVIPILQNAGHRVIAVQLPLHSLSDDVATVKRAIDLVGAPVILVGHSYGGFVITNAAYNNPSVKGLVYVAAFAPKEGQSLSNFIDASKLPKGFLVFDSGGFIYINPALFHQAVAPDTDPAQAKVLASAQKPYSKSILTEKSVHRLGNNYLVGTKSQRTTALSRLMLNECLQNRSMPLLFQFHLATLHFCLIQMRLRN